jgi:peptide/nickel transport system substrate-binding protein
MKYSCNTRILVFSIKILFFWMFVLTACNSPTQDPDSIVIAIESDADQIDPRLATDAASSKINRLLYNGLFKTDEQLQIVPDLADVYEYKSPTSLYIKLKNNILFHDDSTLSADDVLATFSSISNSSLNSPHKGNFDIVENIEKLSDFEILISIKKPFTPFLTALTLPILSERILQEEFKPIGTGPYKLDQKIPREKIVLTRFEKYFDGPSNIQKITFRVITDDTLRVLDLIKGRVDLIQNAIPAVLIESITNQNAWYKPEHVNLSFKSSPGINVAYLGFNLKHAVLSKPEIRKAIALTLNRNDLIQFKLKGQATPSESILSPNHWAYNSSLKAQQTDIEQAKALLDLAGFPDPDGQGPIPRFEITYKTSTKKDRIEMAELIASQLGQIGIKVTVKPYEWGIFYRDIRQGDFEIFSLTWVGITDPDIFYYAFHSTQTPPNGANRGFFNNKELDALVLEAQQVSEIDKRKKIYWRIQEILAHELPIIPLWYENNYVGLNNRIKKYELRPDAGYQNITKATSRQESLP